MLVRSEFSFGTAYGSVSAVADRLPYGGVLADTTCFGHVPFAKEMAARGRKAVLGWRVRVHKDLEGKRDWREVIIVPRSASGLREMYAAVKLAGQQFHYTPRLLAEQLAGRAEWALFATRNALGSPPETLQALCTGPKRLSRVDNFYPAPSDREAWAYACPRARGGAAAGHILTPDEWEMNGWERPDASWLDEFDTPLPRAENIKFGVNDPIRALRDICESELTRRQLGPAYRSRLETELAIIAEKNFADYFLVIGDMIRWAKQRMLVGPARGSSSGSVVCWLTRITEIDPLIHGLIFERFVDLNRFDLPDIDIDFADVSRHLVVEYLATKYGQHNVAHIGTVLRWKPKSALTDVAKALHVPDHELKAFKDVILERSSGDARVNDCLADSFETMESGRELLRKYPMMRLAEKLEGAAKTSGTHAAGLIVCNAPVEEYCAVGRAGIAQIDKKSAEALNMLKIDALGLRTLSVIDTACQEAVIDRESLYTLPLDDPAAFAILNNQKFNGIFQFEGLALQSLASQIEFRSFDDVAAIGALARPGPLASGETAKWIARHAGKEPPTPPHPALEPLCRDTYGVIMYQEQVMRITRELAGFSWKETADIRKLMSARQGDESFKKWTSRFVDGCVANGVERKEAERIWKAINTFGSWAFNKSHSVAYGIVSYWCCWLKAHHPLAFALGCLRHERDKEASVKLLREIAREGIEFVPLDRDKSMEGWTVADGKLIGGLLGVKGIGAVTAREIVNRRANEIPLKPSHQKLLREGKSVFDNLFPTRDRWHEAYAGRMPQIFKTPPVEIADLQENGSAVIVGRLMRKNLRDVNEDVLIARRGGRRLSGPSKWLVFTVEDDTERITCLVDRFSYEKIGAPVVDKGVVGQWFAVRGKLHASFRALDVEAVLCGGR